jgi:outer membrane lipoprotein carrier protein
MKIILRSMISIIFFALFTATHAASTSSDLAGLLNAIRSMKADFTQTIYDNRGKAIQRSYGKMAMQRPGKFRWNVTKPIPQLIIANGSKLWIYDPDLQQVTIRSLKKEVGETPALLLSNVDTTVDQDFQVTEQSKTTPGWRWFSLVPKHPDSMFAAVEMGFQNNRIQEMKLKDNLGHTTRIQYQQPEYNISLAPSLFSFSPPKNVDVINETRKG